jgi:NADH-quinone oxidoreductase subunit A
MASSDNSMTLLIYGCAVLALIAVIIGLSAVLGQRRSGRATILPFESGILPLGDARVRLPVQYYLVAMIFVIFDMETVFIFAWAIVVRQAGWAGYGSILVFVTLLLVAFVYLWRTGALDWGPAPRSRLPRTARTPYGDTPSATPET